MVDVVTFPGNLQISDRDDPQLVSLTRSGGTSLNGIEQVISPLSQRWKWSVTIPIRRKDQARSLRVMLSQLQGRYGYLRMRVCDLYRVSRREMGATPITSEHGVPHSDGAYFSDDEGYHLAGGTTSPVAAVAEGDTSMVLDTGIPIVTGTFFSINDWLYVIEDIDDPEDLDNPGTARTIHFAPPLREAATIEDELNFDPVAIWQLATDDTGALQLSLGKRGVVTLDLVEPVGRDL
jgi:hypothetical protein